MVSSATCSPSSAWYSLVGSGLGEGVIEQCDGLLPFLPKPTVLPGPSCRCVEVRYGISGLWTLPNSCSHTTPTMSSNT